MVIVDSVDYHASHREVLEGELIRFLQKTAGTKKIIGVGTTKLFKRNLPPTFNDPYFVMHLGSVPVGSREYEEFITSFLKSRETEPEMERQLRHWVSLFGLDEVDVLTLWMLLRKTTSVAYDKVATLSDFYALYCQDYLSEKSPSSGAEPTLAGMSKIAHKHFIKQEPVQLEGQHLVVAWELLHYHQSVQDFLIANHVIETLVAVGHGDLSGISDLDFVYPQNVDRFCKEIMNRDAPTELLCLAGAERVVIEAKSHRGRLQNALTHVCYLAGRIKSAEAREKAVWFLEQRKQECERTLAKVGTQSKKASMSLKNKLLYERTIYISLAYLGNKEASRQYIKKLMKHRDWDNLNRGFHLEYYRDIPYIPDSEQMAHVDELKPFPSTYRALRERLLRAVKSGNRSLFEIEFFTLLSLAQHRHAKGLLEQRVRQEIRELITYCRPFLRDELLREYTEMIDQNFGNDAFRIGAIAEHLYKLKEEKRKGWATRGLRDVESVADHTFGALLLAKIYLPESAPANSAAWKGYDKAEVLRELFIHDWAEAFTGDLLPEQRDEKSRKEEAECFFYLEMLNTYEGVHGLHSIRSTWEAFDKVADINSKIAADVDKLENLMQLYLYNKQGQHIQDFETWKQQLSDNIRTDAGQAILDLLRQSFEK